MTDQNPTNEVASEALHVTRLDAQSASKSGKLPFIDKLKPLFLDLITKLYSNKLVFWSICIFLSIVLFIIIVGSLFSRGRNQAIIPTPTKIPFVSATPVTVSDSDTISILQDKLNFLKKQLDNLDIKQSQLTPPTLNFDIKF